VSAVHAPAPGGLELVERLRCAPHRVGVGAHKLLSALAPLDDHAGSLQHRDVLLHRGEAHRVVVGELGHRRPAAEAAQ